MVGFDQVNFRKNWAACHAVIEGLHVKQGVHVRHCDCIEAAVVTAGVPGAVLFGYEMQERRPRRVGVVNKTCFIECKELLFGNMVLLWAQPRRAGENGSCTSCVNVVYDTVERHGGGGTGLQHRWEFLEQLLYLGWKSGDSGLGTPGFTERSSTCLGEGAAQGHVQNLLFRGDYRKTRMGKKIPAM
jgi:hypothetical protein